MDIRAHLRSIGSALNQTRRNAIPKLLLWDIGHDFTSQITDLWATTVTISFIRGSRFCPVALNSRSSLVCNQTWLSFDRIVRDVYGLLFCVECVYLLLLAFRQSVKGVPPSHASGALQHVPAR